MASCRMPSACSAISTLRSYKALRAAVAVAAGPEIAVDDLSLAPAAVPGTASERERLEELLSRHAGNISAVARELATSRTQVQRHLTRHTLSADDFKR